MSLCTIRKVKYYKRTLLILVAAIFASCNTLKYVPKDKAILDRNFVIVDNNKLQSKEIENIIQQQPNRTILKFFRFHLGLYNLSKPESNRWLSRNLRKIGEEPVIYDELMSEKSVKQISLYLKNRGYYNNIVADSIVRNKRHVKVFYKIRTGAPYLINKVDYLINDDSIRTKVIMDTAASYLKPESIFDVDVLQNERIRIEGYLKNRGYFAFSKEYIHYQADSSLNSNHVNLELNFKDYMVQAQNDTSKIPSKHPVYFIGEIKVMFDKLAMPDSSENIAENKKADTVLMNSILLYYPDGIIIKPNVICNNIYISPGLIFSQRNVDETFRALNSLKTFRYVNISFIERFDSISMRHIVDCRIQLSFLKFQSYQTEGEVTHSSGLGIAGNINYQHKNMFRGAEMFEFKIKGGTEAIKKTNSDTITNTIEFGGEIRIQIPKFLLPFNLTQFSRKYNPKTSISMAYDYLRRPEYTSAITNLSLGYNWKGNKNNNFQVSAIDINYFRLLDSTKSFHDFLDTTILGESYRDQLIVSSGFTFTFNNQRTKKNSNFIYFRSNTEFGGNSLNLLFKSLNLKPDTDGFYKIVKNPFAQFVKFDFDFRYYLPVNETDRIVYRIFAGAVYPYGNSRTVPIVKQYFAGGANSIRAWKVRDLGPGSFYDPKEKYYYPNKTSDIKLELNVEYRFKLVWILEGALFVDAGNIWAIKDDGRTGAMFKFADFPYQIAVGSGFGIRLDLTYFVLRVDAAAKMRDPIKEHGKRWIFSTDNYINKKLYNAVLGIGYPF